eukprot:CAMPEP_0201739228 /NCGR_PEP_ID=MMETSP0593-20130828/45670_1 /ASSEMBLY_ACC=CAM_ASM_000672 /TAXON_ID=267983 /ORGANISM="Skeletonema japonicum, Strain CCMP2506" /LENGTH=505 /DNA_ID=CAMNT_0048233483 /DNA_START=143 /DNA_END=1660 /DNA_ORIENTATION=+
MPHVEIPQAELKLVILGDANCGKTSLVTRFTQGYYRQQQPQQQYHNTSTLSNQSLQHQQPRNPNFVTKSIPVTSSNIPTKIQIWDVAGCPTTTTPNNNHNSNHNSNTNSVNGAHTAAKCYYSTSSAILLGYDVTSRSSYEGMRSWLNELRRTISFSVVVVAIVALKTDLLHTAHNNRSKDVAVQEYEVEQLAQALNVMYIPTSSKLDVNVTNLFSRVAEEVLLRRKRGMGMGGSGSSHPNNHLQWNGNVNQFTNGLAGGRKKEKFSASSSSSQASGSVTTDNTRPSSPMSSKELYGKYYETDNTTNTIATNRNNGNHNALDGNQDYRDDSNTSSSMMLPNIDMIGNNNSSKELYGKYYETDNTTNTTATNHIALDGNQDYRDDSNTSSSMMLPNIDMIGNNNNTNINNNDNDAITTTTISSSNAADGRCTPVAMMTSLAAPNKQGGIRKVGQENECDITLDVDPNNENDGEVLNGGEEEGENNGGSFFMMCGGPTWCGKTSDTID